MRDYSTMSDKDLQALKTALPKYLNDCNPAQIEEGKAIYAELLKRWKNGVEEYNQAATAATGLKHGDRVQGYFNGLFGMAGESVNGKIIYDKNGRLAVKYDKADGTGKKTGNLHKGLKKI